MSKFKALDRHVDDDTRVQELIDIEANLREHPFPPQLVVENTSYCNLWCIHCSHRELTRKHLHMDRSLWNTIVEEVGRESPDCELWPTFYGEALILKRELWDRLEYADKVGCRNLVLNSNGTLLDRWDNLNNILNSPLKRFILSLDGASKETFEKIRANAKFEKVYPAVERLCELRAKLNRTYPVITVQFSVMKENVHEVDMFFDHWKKFGADVKIRPMLEWGAVGTVRTDSISHDDSFRIACPWGNNTMAIHADGTVVACAIDFDANVKAENIRNTSVKSAWEKLGTIIRQPHRDHRWNDIPDLCKGCGDWQVSGAEYEETKIEGVRPFWYSEKSTESHSPPTEKSHA